MVYNGHPVHDARPYSLADDGPGCALSTHFRLSEFACRDSDLVVVHPVLLFLLEDIRRKFGGIPIHINSGFRTAEHNASVGGAPLSRHQYGMAADITIEGIAPSRVADLAEAIGAGGVGRYASFTHVDVGRTRRWSL